METELTEWFNPNKYSSVRTFTPRDWFEQIAWRRLLFFNAVLTKKGVNRILALEKYYYELRENPKLDLSIESVLNEVIRTFSDFKDLHTLDPLLFETFYKTNVCEIVNVEDVVDLLYNTTNDSEKDYITLLFDEKAFRSMDDSPELDQLQQNQRDTLNTIGKEIDWDERPLSTRDDEYAYFPKSFYLQVDLTHSNAAILESVEMRLTELRSSQDGDFQPKKRRSPPYQSWRTSKTLELIDLRIFSEYLHVDFPSTSNIYTLLFPNDERDPSTLYKITKRNADHFLGLDTDELMESLFTYSNKNL